MEEMTSAGTSGWEMTRSMRVARAAFMWGLLTGGIASLCWGIWHWLLGWLPPVAVISLSPTFEVFSASRWWDGVGVGALVAFIMWLESMDLDDDDPFSALALLGIGSSLLLLCGLPALIVTRDLGLTAGIVIVTNTVAGLLLVLMMIRWDHAWEESAIGVFYLTFPSLAVFGFVSGFASILLAYCTAAAVTTVVGMAVWIAWNIADQTLLSMSKWWRDQKERQVRATHRAPIRQRIVSWFTVD